MKRLKDGFRLAILFALVSATFVKTEEIPGTAIITFENANTIEQLPSSMTNLAEVTGIDEVLRQSLIAAGVDSLCRLSSKPIPDYSVRQLTVRDVLGLPPLTTANFAIAKLDPAKSTAAVLEAIDTISAVRSVSSDCTRQLTATPNDYDFYMGRDWGFRRVEHSGIGAETAWDIERGNSAVSIAVLDNGFYVENPDFGGQTGPFNKIRFTHGSPISPDDEAAKPWHGTCVAGVAAGLTNNRGLPQVGYSGLSAGLAGGWSYNPETDTGDMGCGLWLYKTTSLTGDLWALGNVSSPAVRVINYSAGTCDNFWNHNLIEDQRIAIWEVYINGALFVASMGNSDPEGCENGDPDVNMYPAAHRDVVFAVGATDQDGRRVTSPPHNYESSIGYHIDVCAPGVQHWAISSTYDSRSFDGTSCSAPMVSGAAALLFSHNPNLQPRDVENILKQTAWDIDPAGYDIYTGHGRINLSRAMAAISLPNVVEFHTATGGYQGGGVLQSSVHFMISDVWWNADRYEVRKQVTFEDPYWDAPLVWGRLNGATGTAPSTENYELYWTGVVEGSVTETGCELVSYVFNLRNTDLWYPCRPNEVVFSYGVAGEFAIDNPTSLIADYDETNDICHLTWDDVNKSENGTEIQRKVGSTGDWTVLDTAAANVTTWDDFDLASATGGEAVFYRVRPFSVNQWIPQYSPEAHIVNIANPPSNVQISPVQSISGPLQSMNLRWNYPLNQVGGTVHSYEAEIFYPAHNETYWLHELTGYSTRFCSVYPSEEVRVKLYAVYFSTFGRPSSPVSSIAGAIDVGCHALPLPEPELKQATETAMLPGLFYLEPITPNPFNLSTSIRFAIGAPSRVAIDIFNVIGERVCSVVDDDFTQGEHSVQWRAQDTSGKDLASGVYFVRMVGNGKVVTRKALLLK